MMKRPLALVGFCYLLTLAAAVYFGACWSLFWLAVFFWVPCYLVSSQATGYGCFSCCTAYCVAGVRQLFRNRPIRSAFAGVRGKDAVITGTVCELPYQAYNRFYYVVEVNDSSLGNTSSTLKIRLSTQKALQVEPYSRIKGKVHLFLPTGGEGYSSRTYYASKGITMFAFLYEYEHVEVHPPVQKPPYYYALKLRSALYSQCIPCCRQNRPS